MKLGHCCERVADPCHDLQEVVVGEICLMEPGEIIPVDGVFLSGHNVQCDESDATGESDEIKKAAFEVCLAEHRAYEGAKARGEEPGEVKKDPFIISGSRVLEGVGSYVAIAVGERSMHGRILKGKFNPAFTASCWRTYEK